MLLRLSKQALIGNNKEHCPDLSWYQQAPEMHHLQQAEISNWELWKVDIF